MVFVETPQIIKESVAASHIALWGEPQFTRSGMIFFTLIFGFFGLHHLMLRSPLTALLFFLFNALTLGYWYFFDLIQLIYTSEEDLNKYGLGSPFLTEFGVAVGMWINDKKPETSTVNPVSRYLFEKYGKDRSNYHNVMKATTDSSGPAPGPATETPPSKNVQKGGAIPQKTDGSLKDTAGVFAESLFKLMLDRLLSSRGKEKPKEYNWEDPPPSAWWTFLFLLTTPFEMLSSAIAGDMWACFFHAISIFPFMFLLPVVFFRSVCITIYTILFPMEVFIQGVSRPFPFVYMDNSIDINGRSERIQRTRINEVDPDANYKSIQPFIDIFKQGLGLAEGMLAYVPLAAGGRVGGSLDKFANAALITAKAVQPVAPVPDVSKPAGDVSRPSPMIVQRGGAMTSSSDTVSLGVIGAVLAGGLLIGLSRTAINVFQGKDDSPPNTGRV
jgi:hypothetical protein